MSETPRELQEMLEDGTVLTQLINEHDLFRDENSFMLLFNCLALDPPVWVPITVSVSDEDIQSFLQAGIGGVVTTKNDIRMKPDILKTPEGKLYFPAFSLQEETPAEYRSSFSWIKMPMSSCTNAALLREDLEGLVLNGFSHSVVLPKLLLTVLKEIYTKAET